MHKLELSNFTYQEYEAKKSMLEENNNGSSELAASNPINAFHAVKRLAVDFDKVVEDLKKDKFEVFDHNIKMQKRIARVEPEMEDFHGLAQSMIRFVTDYCLLNILL